MVRGNLGRYRLLNFATLPLERWLKRGSMPKLSLFCVQDGLYGLDHLNENYMKGHKPQVWSTFSPPSTRDAGCGMARFRTGSHHETKPRVAK